MHKYLGNDQSTMHSFWTSCCSDKLPYPCVELAILFKALSIAQRFILLLPVHGITAPCEQKSTLFKLVWESVSGVYAHSCMGYCESNVQVIVNLMCRTCVYHCRGCYAVIRKYSAYTEAKM